MLKRLLNRIASPGRARCGVAIAGGNEVADPLIARGNAAETEGHLREACELYGRAVAAAPGYAKAHLNLGIGLEAAGDVDGAIKSYQASLAIDPASAPASYNLGKLLFTRGDLPSAARLLQSALANKPEFPEAHVVLSSVYDAQGDLDAAAAQLEAALSQRPEWAGALLNYGAVLRKLGRSTAAEAALRRVLTIDSGNADAYHELGRLLHSRGALQEAERSLHLALEHRPEFPEAHFALSDVHDSLGDLDAAAADLEIALAQRPNWASALNNYGIVLHRLQRLTEAEAALRNAIAVEPEAATAYRTLGAVLVNQSRIAEALAVFRAGREHDPQEFDLESAELFTLNLAEDIASDDLYARHKAFGARLETAYPRRFEPFRNSRNSERRLRIGYVSGDFCNHGVALFTLPLLDRHDRSTFHVFCYSVGTVVDDFTRVLRGRADVWREAAALSHAELADTINRDGIDILVDLSGHSGARLAVFAQRPAPVQASWLGYLSTTGLTRIQYRLCDRYTDPEGAERLHTETLVRLPNSQWCYRPRSAVDYTCPEIPPFGENGFITFGSFNHIPKLSPSTRNMWTEILARVPDSHLVLVGVPEGHARESLVEHFVSAGVAASRLTVVGRVPIQEYFRWYNAVDIALDTSPYSGGTTTCDALWMGVPVITLPGSRPVSRSATGILSAVGLPEWIAASPEDYVGRTVEFARASDAMARLRGTLRQRMRESPLMDEVRFAHDVEDAYRKMWRTYCSGAAPS